LKKDSIFLFLVQSGIGKREAVQYKIKENDFRKKNEDC